MENTLGKKIATRRKERGFTQDELAEQLAVSPQAVSKWENDLSCPDIQLLPKLAELLGCTVDDLLTDRPRPVTELVPPERRKSVEEMMFRVVVNSTDGDRVRINLPMALVKMALQMGMEVPQFAGSEALRGLDLEQILRMVDSGVIGKLVEVESKDGDVVEVVVE